MKNTEFIELWKSQDEKINAALSINKKLLLDMISQKANSSLKSFTRLTIIGTIAFIFYLLLLGNLLFYAIWNYSSDSNYFIVSISAIMIINISGFLDYIKHLIWIDNINNNGNIVEIQEILIRLQTSLIKHTRIMVLQFPFWTTFYISSSWFPYEVGTPIVILQIIVTATSIYFAYWLYKNLGKQNFNNKLITFFIRSSGIKSVLNAKAFYKEIEEFKNI